MMRRGRDHVDHQVEFRGLVERAARELRSVVDTVPDVPVDAVAAFIAVISVGLTEAYMVGRRHSICTLIERSAGEGHPAPETVYIIEARVAAPEEQAEALEQLRDLIVPDLTPEPPSGDRLN